jgi:hypothetical protein
MTAQVKTAVEQILALRAITRDTGTKTNRSQNTILQALPDTVLIEVCVEIQRAEQAFAPLYGKAGERNDL